MSVSEPRVYISFKRNIPKSPFLLIGGICPRCKYDEQLLIYNKYYQKKVCEECDYELNEQYEFFPKKLY